MRAALVLIALSLTGTASAQPLVSAAPDRIEVTVYRDPDRGEEAMDLGWLDGFALISERRRVRLPAGESVVRFEGVAGGIVPQSAIVTGFPNGVVERNRDAYLLSPGTLLDRSLGRRVHLRRTSLATGVVREQEAVVRSGAGGAVVLESADGIEALRCTGLPETIAYDEVPAELSAKPTLAVRVRTAAPVEADVTLSYLATGFDWEATYLAELSDDGRSMRLFAWLALASTDETGFPNADTQAVAGRPNYERAEVPPSEGGPLELRCWPGATTSDIVDVVQGEEFTLSGAVRVDDVINELPQVESDEGSIIVTASRVGGMAQVAAQEDLGDLKLYRIPEPVTIAANSQKQVALLVRENVPVDTVYRYRDEADDTDVPDRPANRFIVTRNREQENLGLPLPSGTVAAFVAYRDRPFLIGQGSLADHAVGEDVEIDIGAAPGVTTMIEAVASGRDWEEFDLTVTSDRPHPIRFEAELAVPDDMRLTRASLPERDGMRLWAVEVPANGSRTLRYRLQRNPRPR